jgi:hypothetical protein
MQGVSTKAFLESFLAAGLTGRLADLKLALGTANITPGRNTVLADIVEAAYTGYARTTPLVGPVSYNETTLQAQSVFTTVETFVGPTAGLGTTALSWALLSPAGVGDVPPLIVIASGMFDAPVSLDDASDAASFVLSVDSVGTVRITQVA